jgi:hypothetical protein
MFFAVLGYCYIAWGAYVTFCHREELEEPGEFRLCKRHVKYTSISVRIFGRTIFWPVFFVSGGIDAFTMGLRLRAPIGRRRKIFLNTLLPALKEMEIRMRHNDIEWPEVAAKMEAWASDESGNTRLPRLL